MPQPLPKSSYRLLLMSDYTRRHCTPLSYVQRRWMTSSKRVQDRSQNKRVHDLEIATEKHKIVSKSLYIFEVLKTEPQNIITLRNLNQHRRQINLPKQHKISNFLQKSPKLFELYKDQRGVVWCGLTEKGEELVKEEEEIIEKNGEKAAEYVTRMLMMAVDKRLPLDKIANLRRDLGLPVDFRKHWVHNYPEYFRVVKPFKPYGEGEYLELVSWKSNWAFTELEKKVLGIKAGQMDSDHVPGLLSLAFPLKFPSTYKKVYRYGGKIAHFQKREYLSPYADARGLTPGSPEFDKRAVAVMHELLSFTIDKRLVTDFLTHFRREFVMPQKLMRLLLKHFGIFYVSERGKRFSVFLTEAYDGSELIEKHPLVVWKEVVLKHVGYRGKKKGLQSFKDISDLEVEDDAFLGSESEDDGPLQLELDQDETVQSSLESELPADGSEMEIEENAESMRRTILLQEQIFKHQVRELHRIYNLHKELMDELEKGLIQSKDPQPGVETAHFPAYITRDNKEPSSSCSGEISQVPIMFDLENRSESAPSKDLKGIDEETDVEVELTLSIGHCPRKQISKQCISGTRLHDSDQVGESSSSSLGMRKRDECGDPGSNISSSSGYRDNNRPHWLLQDLSLNRT